MCDIVRRCKSLFEVKGSISFFFLRESLNKKTPVSFRLVFCYRFLKVFWLFYRFSLARRTFPSDRQARGRVIYSLVCQSHLRRL